MALGGGFFSKLFRRRKDGAGDPTLIGGYPTSLGMLPMWNWAEILRAFNQDAPWLRGIVGTIATSVAMNPIRIFVPSRGASNGDREFIRRATRFSSFSSRHSFVSQMQLTGSLVEASNDAPIVQLLDGRNSVLTGFMLMYITQVHQELLGESFWYLERNKVGVPIVAYPIPPMLVKQVPSRVGEKYLVAAGAVDLEIKYDDVIHFKWPDPIAPLKRGAGIGYSLRQEISSDRNAGQMISQRFASQAVPPAIIYIENTTDKQLKELKNYWLDEAHALWAAGVPMLFNRKFEMQEAGGSLQSLQFAELRQIQRDIFINSYGIPPEIIGHQKNANRSTISAAEYLYNKLRILPRLEANRQVLQNRLATQYQGVYLIHYDNPIDEDKEFQLRSFTQMPESVTVDEWRTKLQGLPPLGPERGGSNFIVRVNRIAVTADELRDGVQANRAIKAKPDPPVIDGIAKPDESDNRGKANGLYRENNADYDDYFLE